MHSYYDFTLPANVENLTLEGFNAHTAVGNDEANRLESSIQGNLAVSTLDGKGGHDVLVGQGFADRFVNFGATTGLDIVSDSGGQDEIAFSATESIAVESLSIGRVGNDLTIALNASASVTVQGWYLGASRVVEAVNLYEGGLLYKYSSTQIQARRTV